jgi:hypothetical protein
MDLNTTTATATPKADTAIMELLTFARMAHTLQTAAIAALVFALFTYVPRIKQRIQLAKLPAFTASKDGDNHGKGYLKSAKDMYSEAYQKV